MPLTGDTASARVLPGDQDAGGKHDRHVFLGSSDVKATGTTVADTTPDAPEQNGSSAAAASDAQVADKAVVVAAKAEPSAAACPHATAHAEVVNGRGYNPTRSGRCPLMHGAHSLSG